MSIARISLRIVVFKPAHWVWRRRRKAASARLSAAPYSAHHKLYSEAVVSSAVALAEVGRFGEAVEYVQKAAKALYETAKDVFERVKITVQRLVELFVETVARVLAWVDEHKAYFFLMAAGVVVLGVALNLWGLVELEKLAYAASAAPFVAGLADTGGRATERFGALAEGYERWKDEKVISEIINAPLNGERPFSKLTGLKNLPWPLVELRKALARVGDEVERDATVVAALVLYKTLVKNAEAYREWAGWCGWARGLVEKQEFTVSVSDVKRLRGAHRRLEEVAEEVRRELNKVLAQYASHSRDLYERLRPYLEVDIEKAVGLAEAGYRRFSDYSDANMGTKAYAALLSIARGGSYGHAAMLLMGEGALVDIVLLTPKSAYEKARDIAKGRGEAVDPSRSPKGAVDWEDRAASTLLRYLLGRAVSEDLVFKRVEGGFEVFRVYGGVEARVDVLMVEGQPRFKAGEEVLRRFVEEAKRETPDLSGVKKMWQTLEWLNTDVSFTGRRIEATTAHLWQAAWYIALFGEPESIRGGANVTKEGVKPHVTMYWRREVLDRIIAEEGNELKPLLGRVVKSWRELVDAIDWSWVLKKVEEMVNELKTWIGPEEANDAEREWWVRRMLGELALLVHFAEARRGMDDSRWREERARGLAKAVETLSRGRIADEYADRLAQAIIYYAEGRKKKAEKRIDKLAQELVGAPKEDVKRIKGEVWGVVESVLSGEDLYAYCLARDCADDRIIRKFVAPALELIMLDKALRGEFDREEALLLFGEMYATAVAGDGTVGPDEVELTVGGELGGGAALLRLATLHLLNQLLPDELKFGVRTYVKRGAYNITARGEDAARFMRLLAVTAPSAGGKYLSDKFNELVDAARVEVRLDKDSIRLTNSGVAADLIISETGIAVKYNVYLREKAIELQFRSTDRSRVEFATLLLKQAGVNVEVKKVNDKDEWYVRVTTHKLVAGCKELRDALAEFVREAIARGWVGEKKAESWLEELERGRVLMEGWPEYYVGLNKGALVVSFNSTNPSNIERKVRRFRKMGLEEGKHFSVKMPEGGRYGYVSIHKEGLAYAAWLFVYGSGEQQKLAAEFVEYILQRAEKAGEEVYEKAREIVEEGRARGSLTLKGFEGVVEVDGKKHVVKVIDGSAELEESWSGKKLLKIRITAEVDGIRSDYEITYSRSKTDNAAVGYTYARADAPDGREADAERFSALVKGLTGEEPGVYHMKDGKIIIKCFRKHLDGFKRYAELADVIEKWLEETDR